MNRAAYNRAYYAHTLERRRKLSRERQETTRWVGWLMEELFAARVLHSPYQLYARQILGRNI